MSEFDFTAVYSGLKDFQRDTVEYVFKRLYVDDPPARRFLVADEVGLGKTLVARGVIARAAEHLHDKVDRIDIVYICSNAEIARQNIRRLALPGFKKSAFASRLTMLPLEMEDMSKNRLNFVSFTPGTALDLKGNLGWKEERAVIYLLLNEKWPELVGTKKGPMRVFQGPVSSLENFRWNVNRLRDRVRCIDPAIRSIFFAAIDEADRLSLQRGEPGLQQRFKELSTIWARDKSNRPWEERRLRNEFVGDLRNLLARTCIDSLQPDLVIMDEFQRFRHLLSGDTEAAELAHSLFDYSSDVGEARVLLLSATPYKMYTLSDGSEEEDHYQDFLNTTNFLMDGESDGFADSLTNYGRQLTRLDPENLTPLIEAKTEVEIALRKVMCRTERLASGSDRNGMLREVDIPVSSVPSSDFVTYVALDRVAEELDAQSPMEYWKSAPFFANFWDGYQIGKNFETAASEDLPKAARVRDILDTIGETISWNDYQTYQELDPGNYRLKTLVSDLLDQDAWKLLWMPPSLPYYRLDGPYRGAEDRNLTKRLVFSSWNVVPKVVSTLLSYEAERRMMRMAPKKDLENSPDGRKRFSEPLRFPTIRTSGMSAFLFAYSSPELARLTDPLTLVSELEHQATPTELLELAEQWAMDALTDAVEKAGVEFDGAADERWYWLGPLILDRSTQSQMRWLDQVEIEAWTGEDRSGGQGLLNHLQRAVLSAEEIKAGNIKTGSMPDDLGRVLALVGVGGPANVAWRALGRLVDPDVSKEMLVTTRTAAARIAWGVRSLFNTPEVTQLMKGIYKKFPYWQRALQYCVDGGFQSVLDEYLYVLREFEGMIGDLGPEQVQKLGETVHDVISLRSSDLHAHDPFDLGEDSRVHRMRCRFALAFGQYRSEEAGQVRRSGYVRTAFNSPFWPFVLTTTSVGQEGLDFHLYCHAVVHWNLPANPVDLEQREGRVHRYMGHAVRKNLADRFGSDTVGVSMTPWTSLLDDATNARGDENDLVPFWVYPGRAQIERHVPRLPMSREAGRIGDLRRSLAVYRLVFGQPRQEELVEMLSGYSDLSLGNKLASKLAVDLTPENCASS